MENQKKQNIFPPTVAGVIEVIEFTFGKNWYADKVVEKILRQNKKWGSRDRAFVAEHSYEIVRWWRKLWAILGEEPSLKRKDLHNLFGVYWLWRGNELPDWPKFDGLRDFDLNAAIAKLSDDVGVQASFPDWLSQQAEKDLGSKWATIAEALNNPAKVAIRTNTLRTNRKKLIEELHKIGIETTTQPGFDDALFLEGRPKLTQLPLFKDGHFEVQDAGSQSIAPFLQAQPGDFVIDACAGAGGKTLHLAALMQNQGLLIAMDVEPYKLGELDKRAMRNRAGMVTTSLIKNNFSVRTYEDKADRLLLDVPCSGTGVIRRDVDTKWKLQPEHIERNVAIQRDILSRYPDMLKVGGTLVYATCSILKAENEDQKDWFISNFGHLYTFEEELRLDPSANNDGFYMARFKKISSK